MVVRIATQYYLNCWKPLKLFELQHNTLNGVSVNVAKAEKIKQMAQGQILNALTMGNQQPRPKGKVQRLFLLREVHTSVWKWVDRNM